MSYLGPGYLGVYSRLPGHLATPDIAAIEGRISNEALISPRATLAVGKQVIAVFQGMGLITGLKYDAHPEDWIVPIGEVERIVIGGIRKESLESMPKIPGLLFSSGTSEIQIFSAGGRSATFKPTLFDDDYAKFISVMCSAMSSRPTFREQEQVEVEEYDIGAEMSAADVILGAARYFPDALTEGVEDLALLECILAGQDDAWAGYAIILNENFGFFEYHECLSTDGNPVLLRMEEVTGCDVLKPENFHIAPRVKVKVGLGHEDHLTIRLVAGGHSMRMAVPLEEHTTEEIRAIEVAVGNLLGLIDIRLNR